MKNRILVTSALPYANGPIHLGHLVEYIQTDIFVRYLKMKGERVIYVCADDTHGAPIEINARKQGISPEELIEKMYGEHTRDFKNFQIEFDSYHSTNSPENKYFSDLIFQRLKEKGDIYTREIEQTYCTVCNRFLPDRFVRGICPKCGAQDQYGDVCEVCNSIYEPVDLINPRCALCGNIPIRKNSKHYFFKLTSYADFLRRWIEDNQNFQDSIKGYLLYWINSGLKDWDISRDAPYFGFKILGEEDKYYYVWLDAPIGYISSTKKWCDQKGEKIEEWWESPQTDIIHFIGKDIIYFHFLFWPAVLKGSGFNLPKNIFVHGFLTVNGEKMSKSKGTFYTAEDYLKQFPPEFLRFYYAAHLNSEPQDLDLNGIHFKDTTNGKLIDNFCNLVNRVFQFIDKNLEGKVLPQAPPQEDRVAELVDEILLNYSKLQYHFVVRDLMELSDIGNGFMQFSEPWKILKESKEEAIKTTSRLCELIKILSLLFSPILPNYSKKILKSLKFEDLNFSSLKKPLKETRLLKEDITLGKIEGEPFKLQVPINKLRLQVAEVLEARAHPKADKLIILKINLGDHTRQIVAGIKNWYDPSDLVGKKIIVLSNLKWVKLRGEESQGMLLAASSPERVSILTSKKAPGTFLSASGILANNGEEIGIEEFASYKIEAIKGKVYFEGQILKAEEEEIVTDHPITGNVK
ncbi:MAG: methionine--tRNA ligase [Thermoanaerobaculia bacterium]